MAKLGLVVDLDTCVGCHACDNSATACNLWGASRAIGRNINLKRAMPGISLTRGEK